MISTLIEIAGIQVVLYGLYYIGLRRETDLTWRRAYLLGMVSISFVVPFVEVPAPSLIHSVNETVLAQQTFKLSSVIVAEEATATIPWDQIVAAVSIVGSIALTVFLLLSLKEIYHLYRTGKRLSLGKLWIWLHPQVSSSFSFFHWIFSKDIHPTVIAHEAAHVRLKHSYDVILLQLNRTLFWWNPISWWMLREMTDVHEYQADREALKEENIDEYQELLINTTLSSMGWGLASSFHSGSLLKRLDAMKQKTKRINRWKISTLGALVAIIALVFACEELDKDIKNMSDDSRQISFEELPADMQAKLDGKQDEFTYMITYLKNSENEDIESKLGQLDTIDPELIEMINVNKTEDGKELYIVLRTDASSYDYVQNSSKSNDEVFTLVDEMPEFPGGMDGFYGYIGQHITYPKQARKYGVEGQVFVSFIVDKTGQVVDAEVIRGIGAGCDSVARQVIAAAPTFTPGKQNGHPVDVKMIVPINFKLNDAAEVKQTTNAELIEHFTKGETSDPEAVKKMIERQKTSEVDIDVEVSEQVDLKESEAQEMGEGEATRTALAGAQLASAATQMAEFTVVGGTVPVRETSTLSTELPEYKGGMEALYKFISSNIKYPKQAKSAGIEGRVYVQFVVKTDGTVDKVKVAKGIGAGCDAEAARVVKLLDQWQPSIKDGQAVASEVTLPINFTL